MAISGVSFGKVVLVSGPKAKLERINGKVDISRRAPVIIQDVTKRYQHAPLGGQIVEAANKGDKVFLYVTKDDTKKVYGKKEGWDTLDGILSNMSEYYNARKKSVDETVNKIFEG